MTPTLSSRGQKVGAEQLGHLLWRGWRRRHTGCSTPQILARSKDFYSTAGGDQKKLRSRGGFHAAFPLYHIEPAQTTDAPEKPKQKPNLNKKNI
jgi:hypothetical protein